MSRLACKSFIKRAYPFSYMSQPLLAWSNGVLGMILDDGVIVSTSQAREHRHITCLAGSTSESEAQPQSWWWLPEWTERISRQCVYELSAYTYVAAASVLGPDDDTRGIAAHAHKTPILMLLSESHSSLTAGRSGKCACFGACL